MMEPGEKTSLAFRDVALIQEVSRLYALSFAPIADRFRLSLSECKQVPLSEYVRCINATASSLCETFSHAQYINKE